MIDLSNKPTPEALRQASKQQRGDRSDAEWKRHLIEVAQRLEDTLNLLIELEGPKGMQFDFMVDGQPVQGVDLDAISDPEPVLTDELFMGGDDG